MGPARPADGAPPPRVWPVVAAILAAQAIAVVLAVPVAPGAAERVEGLGAVRLAALGLATSAALAAIALLFGWASPEPLGRRLATGPSRLGAAAWALALAGHVALAVAVAGIARAAGVASDAGRALGAAVAGARPLGAALLVLAAIAAAPLAEELLFRGNVQTRLVARWGPAVGVATTAALVALGHLEAARMPATFALGCHLGLVAFRGRSIRPAIGAHALASAVGLVPGLAAPGPTVTAVAAVAFAGALAGLLRATRGAPTR